MADLGVGDDVDVVDGCVVNCNGKQGGSGNNCSLVVSIFKGKSFVVKDSPGYRCKIVAKVCKQVIETGIVPLTPGQTEPNFNAQLAWSFSLKEIQRLRSDGEALKLECYLVNDQQEIGTQIGYIVIALKEAFYMNYLHEVDPTRSKVYPLLGTKEPWSKYHPKLRLSLHVEGQTSTTPLQGKKQSQRKGKSIGVVHFEDNKSSQQPRASNVKKVSAVGAIHSPANSGNIPARLHKQNVEPRTSRSDAKPSVSAQLVKADEFKFKVNDRGYFELGNMSRDDDLYVLTVTVVFSNYLNLLQEIPEDSDDYKWAIEYSAFGFNIDTGPFELDDQSVSKRGFIGDKATARIRAGGATFYEYLSNTAIKFHVFRTKIGSTNAEEMGEAYFGLSELTKPHTHEVRFDLDVVPTISFPVSTKFRDKSPQLRVSIELETLPAFFSKKWEMTKSPIGKLLQNKGYESEGWEMIKSPVGKSPLKKDHESNFRGISEEPELDNYLAEVETNDYFAAELPVFSDEEVGDSAGVEPTELLFKNHKWLATKSSVGVPTSSGHRREEVSNHRARRHRRSRGVHTIEQPVELIEIGDSATMRAGTYKVSIHFEQLWIKCRDPITDDFILSYKHHPLGLYEPVECLATPLDNTQGHDPTLRCGSIDDGLWNITVSLKRLSNKLLYQPIIVHVTKSSANTKAREPLAHAKVSFGNVFFTQEQDGKRQIKKRVSVFHNERKVKIGYLMYSIQVEMLYPLKEAVFCESLNKEGEDMTNGNKSRFLMPVLDEGLDIVDSKKKVNASNQTSYLSTAKKTEQELEEWKSGQERIFKAQMIEKEKAYLRILSEEWKKKDADREKEIGKKKRLLQQREVEITNQSAKLTHKEDLLKALELEVKSSAQSNTFERNRLLENEKLRYRRLQEDYKIDIEMLQRRIADYIVESNKMKGKILLLETKLKEKEDELARLLSTRNRWSDMEQSKKLHQLTTENAFLKEKLDDTEKLVGELRLKIGKYHEELETMKKQSNLNLLSENEYLKLQLLANQEKNDIVHDRRYVHQVADQIKSTYEFFESNSKTGLTKTRLRKTSNY